MRIFDTVLFLEPMILTLFNPPFPFPLSPLGMCSVWCTSQTIWTVTGKIQMFGKEAQRTSYEVDTVSRRDGLEK